MHEERESEVALLSKGYLGFNKSPEIAVQYACVNRTHLYLCRRCHSTSIDLYMLDHSAQASYSVNLY